MLVPFRSSDRLLGSKALGIYDKMLDTAKAACDKVYAPTLWLDTEKGRVERAEAWLNESLDGLELGEERDIDIASPLASVIGNAASAYLSQLTKLAEKQTDLLVPVDDTSEITARVASLADRIRGQGELTGISSATVSVNGGEPMTLDEMSRRVEHLTKRAD
ncbi:MAG TPA: hypothetical protein VGQ44_17480 [Gemmatimonadaceae bacterium]|jgi:hypothetical protein|nr:hypothetical protein [Gemmatimonadaceae bacterium]